MSKKKNLRTNNIFSSYILEVFQFVFWDSIFVAELEKRKNSKVSASLCTYFHNLALYLIFNIEPLKKWQQEKFRTW